LENTGFARAALFVVSLGFGLVVRTGAVQSPARAETLRVLDDVIDRLADTIDYQAVLRDGSRRLPADADPMVRTALNDILQRAPTTGSQFPCSVDFIRSRARQKLLEVAEALDTGNPPRSKPEPCYATPSVIDSTRSPHTIDIYGLNLDAPDIQLFVVTESGTSDVSSALRRETHFHLTLRTGAGGIELPNNATAVAVGSGNLIDYTIPIARSTSSLCRSRVEEIPAPAPIEIELPLIVSRFNSSVTLDFHSNEVDAMVCVNAAAPTDTHASGCIRQFLLTIDPDRAIDWVFGDVGSRVAVDVEKRPGGRIVSGRTGPVRRWVFTAKRGSRAGGADYAMKIELRPLRIASTETTACIPPIAYLDASRRGQLTPDIRRALDPALRRVDSAIRNLRPRFAAPQP